MSVSFSASATDPTGRITGYTYTFGDELLPFVSFDGTASHTYNETGKYTVKVIAYDDGHYSSQPAYLHILVMKRSSFTDQKLIDTDYTWAKDAIDYIYTFNIAEGYPDGSYRPDVYTKRSEMAAFIARAMDIKIPQSCTVSPFSDVNTDSWYCPYIEALKEAGIRMNTNGSNNYYPAEPMSRADMALFLAQAAHLKITPCSTSPFPDVAKDAWYCPYVQAIKLAGITKGFPDGTYRPDDTVTRAQMAVYLFRAFGER